MLKLFDRTMIACQFAKKDRTLPYVLYDDNLRKSEELQDYVVNNIDNAIERGHIKAYYQPVVRTLTGTFCGMEALARWDDPKYGILNPAVFIGALEQTRQIHKLDSAIIHIVCRQIREMIDNDRPVVPVSFNLSRLDFLSCDIVEVVEAALKEYSIPRKLINVEITESAYAAEKYIREQIQRFRDAGYEVWMDDFGSGYSSLNNLKDYRFDELKIDMSFLSNLNNTSMTIIRSIVRMSKDIDVQTLAEGVETRKQFEFLRDIGCEKVQGYYFGKPMPLEDLIEQMRKIEIPMETAEMQKCFSMAGRVDFLVRQPMAIVSYDGEKFKFLYTNREFTEEINSVDIPSVQALEKQINDPTGDIYCRYREIETKMFQLKNTYSEQYPSEGVYLSLSGKLISTIDEFHLYRIFLKNTAISVIQSDSSRRSEKKAEKLKILIAEDDLVSRNMLGMMLKDDYDVLYAADGMQAYELFRTYREEIACVLADVVMPGLSGLELIERVRAGGNTAVPFIVISRAAEMELKSLSAGASNFLEKPLPPPETVRKYVENAVRGFQQKNNSLRRAMEYIPAALFAYKNDDMQQIVYANSRTYEIFGCANKEEFNSLTEGRFRGMVCAEDYAEACRAIKNQPLGDVKNFGYVAYRIPTRSGEYIQVENHVYRLDDPRFGEICMAFMYERD